MTNEIKKVGVVGAGQMGSGIAHVAALAGFDVVVSDVSPDRLKSSLATISGNMARQVASGKIQETDKAAALARIV
ncbi:MAG: NAD(P)-binding domain-containing protein, partial [Rhizobiales bacterium]|nr:NAD(P)-binding domain-containing protein [Hyphomicrobiales bacterium]